MPLGHFESTKNGYLRRVRNKRVIRVKGRFAAVVFIDADIADESLVTARGKNRMGNRFTKYPGELDLLIVVELLIQYDHDKVFEAAPA